MRLTEQQRFIDALRECLGLEPLYSAYDPRLKFIQRFGATVSTGRRAPTKFSDSMLVRRMRAARVT